MFTENRIYYLVAVGIIAGTLIVYLEDTFLDPHMPGTFDMMKYVRWSLFGGMAAFIGAYFAMEADVGDVLSGAISTGQEPF